MPRAKKGQEKVPILKKTTELCSSTSYYSMDEVKCSQDFSIPAWLFLINKYDGGEDEQREAENFETSII